MKDIKLFKKKLNKFLIQSISLGMIVGVLYVFTGVLSLIAQEGIFYDFIIYTNGHIFPNFNPNLIFIYSLSAVGIILNITFIYKIRKNLIKMYKED